MRRDPLSSSLAATSFGRSVRWWVCSIGTLHWSMALSVPLGFLAAALLSVVPSMIGDTAHADSPAWGYLAGVWLFGLTIQAVVTQTLFTIPVPVKQRAEISESCDDDDSGMHSVILTIGGVWMAIPNMRLLGPQPKLLEVFGGASRVLALWSLMLLSIGIACLGCLLGDLMQNPQTDTDPVLSGSTATIAAVDRPWVAASWIFCLQGFWQLLPLPQSLGRVGWSAVIGLFTRPPELATSDRRKAIDVVRRVQWWLVAMALAILVSGVLAIELSGISTQAGGRAWPALCGVILLALWLFVSARGDDLLASQLILVANGETGVLHGRVGIRPMLRQWQARRRQLARTRKLLEAAQREREEASDAARVDDILQRLHSYGRDALSDEERAILRRVSEAIRHERARNQDPQSK